MSEPSEAAPLTTEGTGGEVAVRIDHDMCSGTRNCERHYGEVFVVDHGKAWIRGDTDWPHVDVLRLREAEAACPWSAIEIDSSSPKG
jgi:ferredoxin